MKNISTVALISFTLLATACVSHKKQFEGYIDYDLTLTVMDSTLVTHDQLVSNFGTKTTAYHKNGKFKDLGDAANNPIQLYLPEDQLLYSYSLSKDDSIEAYNISNESGKYNFEVIENADTILGYPCNLLIASKENVEKRYFFSPTLYINPKYYKNYKMGNRDELMVIMEAPVLKLIIVSKTLKLVSEATNVNVQELNNSVFMLPENRIIKNM
ncbi:MAG: hypothetical protein AB8B72_12980 [Crocinitomicaceae bacterium]